MTFGDTYKLGEDEKIALDMIYERLNIPEEKRCQLTQSLKKEIIGPIYQSTIRGIKHRINNLLTYPYTLIQTEERKGTSSPLSTEAKKSILKIKEVIDRFIANKDLTIDHSIKDTPTLKLANILTKEGL
jgi:hypothetical protein